MEENECLDNIIKFCKREHKKSSWFIFNDNNISFEKVKLLNDYEKDANLPLPSELFLVRSKINHAGIELQNVLYKWSDICCIIIKEEVVPSDFGDPKEYRIDKYVVFSTNDWKIIELKVYKPEQYSNLLGHFIQQYKLGVL